jgi:hypothetical protein
MGAIYVYLPWLQVNGGNLCIPPLIADVIIQPERVTEWSQMRPCHVSPAIIHTRQWAVKLARNRLASRLIGSGLMPPTMDNNNLSITKLNSSRRIYCHFRISRSTNPTFDGGFVQNIWCIVRSVKNWMPQSDSNARLFSCILLVMKLNVQPNEMRHDGVMFRGETDELDVR